MSAELGQLALLQQQMEQSTDWQTNPNLKIKVLQANVDQHLALPLVGQTRVALGAQYNLNSQQLAEVFRVKPDLRTTINTDGDIVISRKVPSPFVTENLRTIADLILWPDGRVKEQRIHLPTLGVDVRMEYETSDTDAATHTFEIRGVKGSIVDTATNEKGIFIDDRQVFFPDDPRARRLIQNLVPTAGKRTHYGELMEDATAEGKPFMVIKPLDNGKEAIYMFYPMATSDSVPIMTIFRGEVETVNGDKRLRSMERVSKVTSMGNNPEIAYPTFFYSMDYSEDGVLLHAQKFLDPAKTGRSRYYNEELTANTNYSVVDNGETIPLYDVKLAERELGKPWKSDSITWNELVLQEVLSNHPYTGLIMSVEEMPLVQVDATHATLDRYVSMDYFPEGKRVHIQLNIETQADGSHKVTSIYALEDIKS